MAACSDGDPEVRPTRIKVPMQGIDYTEIRCPSSFSNESGGRFLNPQISNYPFHASNLTATILIDFLWAFSGSGKRDVQGFRITSVSAHEENARPRVRLFAEIAGYGVLLSFNSNAELAFELV